MIDQYIDTYQYIKGGTEMNPDLFMICYRQQERELDERLEQRLAIEGRLALEEGAPACVMGLSERFRSLVRAIERLRERTRYGAPAATCCATT
ncbi:hypothetical protein E3O62_13130 [Cryobacterium sp. TMT2-15-1]|uniref:hypothetical protein n=1 Tax=Cryobacterium sp. TMT2-15-1 TaxID=1259246 RepID=UPI00106BD3D3|nr:hypothetical protein [Cryobacterium sp. TMT2-15-1]TFC56042.1 hypothetical protein E3O62_13130 [Cryobacterium sp. TMT2-15-1]